MNNITPRVDQKFVTVWSTDECEQHSSLEKAISEAKSEIESESEVDYVCVCEIVRVVKQVNIPTIKVEGFGEDNITKNK